MLTLFYLSLLCSILLCALGVLRVLGFKLFSASIQTVTLFLVAALLATPALTPQAVAPRSYLGFDSNIYPGDGAIPILRKTFAFTSYWLNPPSGEKTNSWRGKRELLRSQGFGFLVLYLGRDSRELKNEAAARGQGTQDAKDTAASAKTEGFSANTIIFLDVEEGGRLPAAYHAYLRAWFDELIGAGYRPGVYCSGIPVEEGPGITIATADDIRINSAPREFVIWAFNDVCPPSPGCTFPQNPPAPKRSGIPNAAVWQFAQSPRRKERTSRCAATYHRDGNCYAPGDTARAWFLDLNSASSADPSGGSN